MLRDSLNTVVISSIVGKDENSSASFIYIVISKIITESEMFTNSKKSSSAPPATLLSGIMIARTIKITNTANTFPLILFSIIVPPFLIGC